MAWRKLGRVFAGAEIGDWSVGYAAVPLAVPLDDGHVRVIFSARDPLQRSRPAALVLDMARLEVVALDEAPLLSLGALGAFDDSGVMPCWQVAHEGRHYLYYIGWNRSVTVPFRNAIGLAVSADGGATYSRAFAGPVIDRSRDEPYFCASCCVLVEAGRWRNWYLSCTGWEGTDGAPRHHYHIKYAESDDGIAWRRDGRVAIDYASVKEYAISRPCVRHGPDGYRMWFSARGEGYRIYEAGSPDGLDWARRQDPVLDVSGTGWDAEMVCYPFVFDHGGGRYMLYNGNGYGKTGFGLALWEEEP
ncbi:MAG: hypothetical protein ACOY99_01445 [Pseudomonadota bacterium]